MSRVSRFNGDGGSEQIEQYQGGVTYLEDPGLFPPSPDLSSPSFDLLIAFSIFITIIIGCFAIGRK